MGMGHRMGWWKHLPHRRKRAISAALIGICTGMLVAMLSNGFTDDEVSYLSWMRLGGSPAVSNSNRRDLDEKRKDVGSGYEDGTKNGRKMIEEYEV